jgi:hypothetical protein
MNAIHFNLQIKTNLTSKKTMNYFPNKLFTMIVITISLTSCGNLSNEVDNKLNELKNKTESLDSVINKEVNKVLMLDSLINREGEKVKKLDSLINKNSSKLDSISNEKFKLYEKIIK